MLNIRNISVAALCLVSQSGVSPSSAASLPTFANVKPAVSANTVYSWMSPEIGAAWSAGFKGQGVTLTFVDDFSSSSKFSGNFGTGVQTLRHGEWTRMEGGMIAPSATIVSQDFSSGRTVGLARGLNVINLSYATYAAKGYTANQIGWSAQESSLINYAGGSAVIAKAAGNDGVAVGAANSKGQVDYLNLALVGKTSAIFVGALNSNGTTASKATLASYSDYAGSNATVQKNFLVVGVTGDKTGLYGTSFAAPIVAGYAAVLGSKFNTATSTQITNQLLNTARQDTLMNYSATVYGRGEASISRALAPVSIR
jgi:subtilisin family serine protease